MIEKQTRYPQLHPFQLFPASLCTHALIRMEGLASSHASRHGTTTESRLCAAVRSGQVKLLHAALEHSPTIDKVDEADKTDKVDIPLLVQWMMHALYSNPASTRTDVFVEGWTLLCSAMPDPGTDTAAVASWSWSEVLLGACKYLTSKREWMALWTTHDIQPAIPALRLVDFSQEQWWGLLRSNNAAAFKAARKAHGHSKASMETFRRYFETLKVSPNSKLLCEQGILDSAAYLTRVPWAVVFLFLPSLDMPCSTTGLMSLLYSAMNDAAANHPQMHIGIVRELLKRIEHRSLPSSNGKLQCIDFSECGAWLWHEQSVLSRLLIELCHNLAQGIEESLASGAGLVPDKPLLSLTVLSTAQTLLESGRVNPLADGNPTSMEALQALTRKATQLQALYPDHMEEYMSRLASLIDMFTEFPACPSLPEPSSKDTMALDST